MQIMRDARKRESGGGPQRRPVAGIEKTVQGGGASKALLNAFFAFVLAFSMVPMAPASAHAAETRGSAQQEQEASSAEAAGGSSLAAAGLIGFDKADESEDGQGEGGMPASEAVADGEGDASSDGDVLVAQEAPASQRASDDGASELAPQDLVVQDKDADVWDGAIDVSWYDADTKEFTLTKPAQLAGLAYITSPKSGTDADYEAWANGERNSMATDEDGNAIPIDDFAGKTVKLGADLNMGGSSSRLNKPIADVNNTAEGAGGAGTSTGTFSGVAWKGAFDGQGHTVSNLYLDGRVTAATNFGGYQGLFSAVADGAVITKLGVTGTIFGRVIGGVAAISRFAGDQGDVEKYPIIQNCWTNVRTQGNGSGSRPTGGIFGGEGTRSICVHVVNCYTLGRAHNGQTAGGVVGFSSGTVAGTYTLGEVAAGNSGTIVATLYKPGYATGDLTESHGYYAKNIPVQGLDPNGNAYRYMDGTAGGPFAVTGVFSASNTTTAQQNYEGLMTAAQLNTNYNTANANYGLNSSNSSAAKAYAYNSKDGDTRPMLWYQKDAPAINADVDLSSATIDAIPAQTYTSKRIEPTVTVKLGTVPLTRGTDYIVKYENNISPTTADSKAKVTVFGVGRYYGQTASAEFDIETLDLSSTTITDIPNQWRYGAPVTPAVTVKSSGGNTLTEGVDYQLVFENNDAPGVAKVTVAPIVGEDGVSFQTGSNSTTFNITEAAGSLKGSGTEADPYQISNRGELQFLAHMVDLQDSDYLGKNYKVVADFSLVPEDDKAALNQPVGYKNPSTDYYYAANRGFYGTFDGDGHTITLALSSDNIWPTNSSNKGSLGLFGMVSDVSQQAASANLSDASWSTPALIKNLTVDGTVQLGGAFNAGIVAYAQYADLTIENCTNKATLSGGVASSHNAGIIGQAGRVTLNGCTNEGELSITNANVAAGILGSINQATQNTWTNSIEDCHNAAAVTDTGIAYMGGILGDCNPMVGTILMRGCSNTGDITAGSSGSGALGGIVGRLYKTGVPVVAATIDSCFNAGNVGMTSTGNVQVGGILGVDTASIALEIAHCYNAGEVSLPVANAGLSGGSGGIVGALLSNSATAGDSISGCYNTGEVTGSSKYTSYGSGVGSYQHAVVSKTNEDLIDTIDVVTLATLDSLTTVGYDRYGRPKPVDANGDEITAKTIKVDNKTDTVQENPSVNSATADALKGAQGVATMGSAAFVAADNPAVTDNYVPLFWQVDGQQPFDLGAAQAEAIEDQVNTGKAVTPEVTLSYTYEGDEEATELVPGIDFLIAGYEDNVETGAATANIVGLGRFGGTAKTVTFNIVKGDLSKAVIDPSALPDETYTGEAISPTLNSVTLTCNGEDRVLKEGTDYDKLVLNNVNPGKAQVVLAGIGLYEGSKSLPFTITGIDLADGNGRIADIEDQLVTGSALTPEVTVTYGDKELVQGTDYTLEYDGNVAVGTATVTVTGKGTYSGTLTGSFEVLAKDLTKAEIAAIPAQAYTGKAIEPELEISLGDTELVRDRDYMVTYANNVNAGTARAYLVGIGDWNGVKQVSFAIEPVELSGVSVQNVKGSYDPGSEVPVTVAPKLVDDNGNELVADTDYTFTVTDSRGAEVTSPSEEGTYIITFTAKSANYSGTFQKQFDIGTFFSVYNYVTDGGKGTPVKTYTREELEALVDPDAQPVSGMRVNGGQWMVITSTKYVPIDALIEDAGLADQWTDKADIQVQAGQRMTKADIAATSNFYPNATAQGTQTDGARTGQQMVISLEDASSLVTTTAADAETANLASTETIDETLWLYGVTESQFKGLNAAGARYMAGVTELTLYSPYFTVYKQEGADGDYQIAKQYTEDEFKALKSKSTDYVSGLYFKEDVWNVTTATEYVTLDDLLADAGLGDVWTDGARLKYGGDASQGKPVSNYDYATINNMSNFYPLSAGKTTDTSVVRSAPPVLALKEYSSKTSTTQNAAATEESNAQNANTANAPRMIYGVSEAAYLKAVDAWGGTDSPIDGTTAGNRYWSRVQTITVVAPKVSETDEETGVVAEGAQAFAQADASLGEVVKLEVDSELNTAREVELAKYRPAKAELFNIYDVELNVVNSSGEVVRPVTENFGTLTLTFPVAEKFNGRTAKVVQLHQTPAGATEEITHTATVANGAVKVPVAKLSEFIISIAEETPVTPSNPTVATQDMYRMYNPNSGEHFYTADAAERTSLVNAGWAYEGVGWKAPKTSGTPVYRLYNPYAGDHHYTTSAAERDNLKSVGWRDEGTGWYSDDAKGTALQRLYNPYAITGAHHYTVDVAEKDNLVNLGWRYEGIGWYGVR